MAVSLLGIGGAKEKAEEEEHEQEEEEEEAKAPTAKAVKDKKGKKGGKDMSSLFAALEEDAEGEGGCSLTPRGGWAGQTSSRVGNWVIPSPFRTFIQLTMVAS